MRDLSGSYLCRLTFRSVVWPRTLIARFRGSSYYAPEQCTNKSPGGASLRTRGRSDDQYHGHWLHELVCASGVSVVGSTRREGIARDPWNAASLDAEVSIWNNSPRFVTNPWLAYSSACSSNNTTQSVVTPVKHQTATSVLAPTQDSAAHETLGPSAPRGAPLVCIDRS